MVGHDLYHNRLELHLQLAVGRYMIGLTGGHQRKRVKKKQNTDVSVMMCTVPQHMKRTNLHTGEALRRDSVSFSCGDNADSLCEMGLCCLICYFVVSY